MPSAPLSLGARKKSETVIHTVLTQSVTSFLNCHKSYTTGGKKMFKLLREIRLFAHLQKAKLTRVDVVIY